MIVDEQTYLEHYGVKGMKWGIRKDRRRETKSRLKTAKKERKQQKKEARRRVYKTAAVAAVVYSGSRYVSKRLNSNGQKSSSDIWNQTNVNSLFEARDASGKIIARIGPQIYGETLRNLRS